MHRNLARFRLCSHPWCVKGAVVPKNRTKPNGWSVTSGGFLWCPLHSKNPEARDLSNRLGLSHEIPK